MEVNKEDKVNVTQHAIGFVHTCGRKGTMLEICVTQDGDITISGLCAICGEEFSTEDTMPSLIAKAAIADARPMQPYDQLVNFVPKGRPH